MIEAGGAKVFYRLGSKIEHWRKKHNTIPPKDFKKWAVICEHIIRHYTEGWANGFYMDIEYWEIWNEPDIPLAHKPNWSGTDEEWIYSLKTMKGLKGSAYIAANMLMAQHEPLDHLMFYDARPCGMNSMFSTDCVFECLKGYYPFYMFNQLYCQKHAVPVELDGDCIWAAAAAGEEQNVMLSYYDDNDAAPDRLVKVEFKHVENKNGVRLAYYCLDKDHDCTLVREEIFTATEFSAYLTMPVHSTYLLKAVPL